MPRATTPGGAQPSSSPAPNKDAAWVSSRYTCPARAWIPPRVFWATRLLHNVLAVAMVGCLLWMARPVSLSSSSSSSSVVDGGSAVELKGASPAVLRAAAVGRERLRRARAFIATMTSGQEPLEASYAADCALTWDNVYRVVVDFYVPAHFFGWLVVSYVSRDPLLCLVLSLSHEGLEWLFAGVLPNFQECLFDTLVVDVLVCNGLGIWLGNRLGVYMQGPRPRGHNTGNFPQAYAAYQRPGSTDLARRQRWQWQCEGVLLRCGFLLLALLLEGAAFLNRFFLKYLLHIPSVHWLNLLHVHLVETKTIAWWAGDRLSLIVLLTVFESFVVARLAEGLPLELLGGDPRAPSRVLALWVVAVVAVVWFYDRTWKRNLARHETSKAQVNQMIYHLKKNKPDGAQHDSRRARKHTRDDTHAHAHAHGKRD